MPLPKARELREKTEHELNKMLDDHRLELIKLGETNAGRKRALKKIIARILTVMNEPKVKEKKAQKQKKEKKKERKAEKPPKQNKGEVKKA